jgi:AP-3 complex subunit delta-1
MADPAISRLADIHDEKPQSYQRENEDTYLDPDIVARRRAERLERNKDDPFYIAGISSESSTSTPIDMIIRNDNGNDLDIDSIPIMQLDLGKMPSVAPEQRPKKRATPKPHQIIQVAADETLAASGSSTPKNEDSEASLDGLARPRARPKKSPLLVDSSNIGAFSLEGDGNGSGMSAEYEHDHKEEDEMAKAMQEVEKLRLEMQRANERIQAAQGVPPEGTVVKKKAKKKVKPPGDEATTSRPPSKVRSRKIEEQVDGSGNITSVKPKKVKKKVKVKEHGTGGIEGDAEKANPP